MAILFCPRQSLAYAIAALVLPSASFAAALAFSPAPLVFPSTALTESSILKTTFKNTSALSVNLTSVTVGGVNQGEFKQSNDCPVPLPAGKSCTFTVTFKPAALTKRSANLTVTTDDPSQPKALIGLSGNLYPGVLNDTGITGCGKAIGNGLPCPVAAFPGQDADYGRDKARNNDADGHAGFSFTKLDAAGKALPADAEVWRCVRDNVTGLIWEVKPIGDGKPGNQGLHDADDTYTWYSTDNSNNNGFEGYSDMPYSRSCYDYVSGRPATYCNTQAYAERVNAAGWCGKNDWRIPNPTELESLVDFSAADPKSTIAAEYFQGIQSYGHYFGYYWSSSPSAYSSDTAWGISFGFGYSFNNEKSNALAVRLVRSGQ